MSAPEAAPRGRRSLAYQYDTGSGPPQLCCPIMPAQDGLWAATVADVILVLSADVVRSLVHEISPDALQIVDAFGIPAHLLGPLAAGALP